jgi:hypothetical protein
LLPSAKAKKALAITPDFFKIIGIVLDDTCDVFLFKLSFHVTSKLYNIFGQKIKHRLGISKPALISSIILEES